MREDEDLNVIDSTKQETGIRRPDSDGKRRGRRK